MDMKVALFDFRFALINVEAPPSDHIFGITGFPATWKYAQIKKAFSNFGGVTVHWLDDTSALVTLPEDAVDKAPLVLPYFKDLPPDAKQFSVCSFVEFQELKKKEAVAVTSPPQKRRRAEVGQS